MEMMNCEKSILVKRKMPKKKDSSVKQNAQDDTNISVEKINKQIECSQEIVIDTIAFDTKKTEDISTNDKLALENEEKKPKVFEPIKNLSTLKSLVGNEVNDCYYEFLNANYTTMDGLRCVWMRKPVKNMPSVETTLEESNNF